MGEFRGLSRLVSTDLGPHVLPQQSTGKTFLADLTGDMVLRCYRASSTSFSVFRSFLSWRSAARF